MFYGNTCQSHVYVCSSVLCYPLLLLRMEPRERSSERSCLSSNDKQAEGLMCRHKLDLIRRSVFSFQKHEVYYTYTLKYSKPTLKRTGDSNIIQNYFNLFPKFRMCMHFCY